MELNDFVAKFAEQFDDTDVSDILRIGRVEFFNGNGDHCLRKNRIRQKYNR